MPDQLSLRGGTTTEHAGFTGANKEATVDTTKKTLVIHDGATVGGHPLMRENASNSALALGSAATPSLKFAGDTNTGIYSPGADQLALATGGTGRLFVDASGRVGIGTSSLVQALTVNGTIGSTIGSGGTLRLYETDVARANYLIAGADASGAYIDSTYFSGGSGALILRTIGSERLRIDSSGRLGLGTSSPGSALDVRGEIRGGNGTIIGGISYSTRPEIGAISNHNLGFITNNTTQMLLDTSGRLGIGTTSPGNLLELKQNTPAFRQTSVSEGGGYVSTFGLGYSTTSTFIIEANATGSPVRRILNFGEQGSLELDYLSGSSSRAFIIKDGSTERARIDSSGRLLVGTSTSFNSVSNLQSGNGNIAIGTYLNSVGTYEFVFAKSRSTTVGSEVVVVSGDRLGQITFSGSDGTTQQPAASIQAVVDGTPGTNDMPGRLVFSTTADGASSPTERVRINSSGEVYLACQTSTTAFPGDGNTANGVMVQGSGGKTFFSTSSTNALNVNRNTTDGNAIVLRRGGTEVGSISVTTTATAYNTSSDYRLKENIVPLTGAIDRVNQLQVHRFNFISDPAKTVDGFIAHEAQAVVPECVTGTKDEVDDEGNPVYQGIDQSKLVPLLTAALQEALQKIEDLETRLTAAGL
jgi:hypothetical protein